MMKEQIKEMLKSIINGDEEAAGNALKTVLQTRAQAMVNGKEVQVEAVSIAEARKTAEEEQAEDDLKLTGGKIDLLKGADLKVSSSEGRTFTIKQLYTHRRGIMCDLYVQYADQKGKAIKKEELLSLDLFDDKVFVKGINDHLKSLGYKGKTLVRAEMGMQIDDIVALEARDDGFCQWMTDTYEFEKLSK